MFLLEKKSSVEINNSKFNKNFIGIAVKKIIQQQFIENSEFRENKYQVASYAKNWRYIGGGNVNITNSKFISRLNRFNSLSEPEEINTGKKQKINSRLINSDF